MHVLESSGGDKEAEMELRAMSVNLGLIYSRWSVKKEESRMR